MERSKVIAAVTLPLFVAGISLLHYVTPLELPYLHAIFQRLYYFPIIIAALLFGWRGGLACSLLVSLAYAPHILLQWGGHLTVEMEKYLEILLYNLVGTMTGVLSQRERERGVELEKTARGLEESYRKLQQQSERMMAIEEQLRRAEKLSTLGEMAAVLAHEIRNPLCSIRGTAEILKDDYKPEDRKHEFIQILVKETERLNHVVEDFLAMARPQPANITPCPVQEELDTVATLVATDARDRGVMLKMLPGAAPIIVNADGEKLRQAFLNIVINALQATPAGGSVSVSTGFEDGHCVITFSDTGRGMDADTLQHVFDPFFTTKPDGTGLGLAITKKIFETHGGALNVESELGSGTTVIVRLPLPEEGLENKNFGH